MMGFAIAPSTRVLNKLALQTCHKAASGCKGLFGLVANRVGRAGAWWPRAADVPGAGRKGSGSLEPKELGISGGRLSQARTVLCTFVRSRSCHARRLQSSRAGRGPAALQPSWAHAGIGDRVHDHLAQIAAKLVAA